MQCLRIIICEVGYADTTHLFIIHERSSGLRTIFKSELLEQAWIKYCAFKIIMETKFLVIVCFVQKQLKFSLKCRPQTR